MKTNKKQCWTRPEEGIEEVEDQSGFHPPGEGKEDANRSDLQPGVEITGHKLANHR